MNIRTTGILGWFQRLTHAGNHGAANGFARHVQRESQMRIPREQWHLLSDKMPTDENAIYVAACSNRFITVCRWDQETMSFMNMGRDRNINFVVKWLLLPDSQ